MKILVIGGTVFLGRHFVEAALRNGHSVSLFHRGQSNPGLFEQAEWIRGDRTADLSSLEGGRWDAVVDTCGYFPEHVRESASALRPRVGRYLFVSTISVYESMSTPGLTEDAPVQELEGPVPQGMSPEVYGPLKAMCEQEARNVFGSDSTIVRPGLIVGPWDPSDRFTYWVERIARGGKVLAPGDPSRQVQCIDVRDLAEWMLLLLEHDRDGTYHATGPVGSLTMGEFLECCGRESRSDAELVWVGEGWLMEQGVAPYTEIPLWYPGSEDRVSIDRAIGSGLKFRPLDVTVRDTQRWTAGLPEDRTRRGGLDRSKEAELLRAWGERS